MTERERPAAGVQSVERAFALLERVAERDEVGVTELGRQTGLQPSTVHRLLTTLVRCNYVVQSAATGRYRLSHKLVALAGAPERRLVRLRGVVRPHLEAIGAETGETINLIVLEGTVAAYVDQVESSRAVRMFTEIGRRADAHATGGGKAILAFRPEPELEALLAHAPLAERTTHTITGAAALRDELAEVRRVGYALDREEYELGVGCVGAPIIDHAGHAEASLSLSAPLDRIQALDLDDVGRLLAGHAARAAVELGYEPAAVSPGRSASS